MSDSQNFCEPDTLDLSLLSQQTASTSARVGHVRMDFAALSHPGHVRLNNEDQYFVARVGRFLTPLATSLPGQTDSPFGEEGHGLVVADGLGGHAGGELASGLAIRSLLNMVLETPDWIFSPQESAAMHVMERMTERFRRVDEVLVEQARISPQLKGMGTTMTLAANVGRTLILAHIGDSRAYLLRGGVLYQLTHDHTLAQELVDQGLLENKHQAAQRLQHALTRVLGGPGKKGEAEVQYLPIVDQDVLLLCTDGLTDMVTDADVRAILTAGGPPSDLCQTLVERALANGGKDNVTVVVARYAVAPLPAP